MRALRSVCEHSSGDSGIPKSDTGLRAAGKRSQSGPERGREGQGPQSQAHLLVILAAPFDSCVAVGKLPHLSELQFCHLHWVARTTLQR